MFYVMIDVADAVRLQFYTYKLTQSLKIIQNGRLYFCFCFHFPLLRSQFYPPSLPLRYPASRHTSTNIITQKHNYKHTITIDTLEKNTLTLTTPQINNHQSKKIVYAYNHQKNVPPNSCFCPPSVSVTCLIPDGFHSHPRPAAGMTSL